MISEVYNIDCLEFMSKCKDNEFELAIVDPPFNQTWGKIHDLSSGRNKYLKELNDKYKKTDRKPSKKYFDELKRISKKIFNFWV